MNSQPLDTQVAANNGNFQRSPDFIEAELIPTMEGVKKDRPNVPKLLADILQKVEELQAQVEVLTDVQIELAEKVHDLSLTTYDNDPLYD